MSHDGFIIYNFIMKPSYVCFVLMIACILLNNLLLSFFFLQELSKEKKELKMVDYCQLDIQKIMDSDLPVIIKMELEKFIYWDFNETLVESWILLNMLERGVVFRVIDKCRDLNLMESNLKEICLCYENLAGQLLDEEYMLQELVFPETLYMECIKSLIYETHRPCSETSWYNLLPRHTRFHVTYFQNLRWYVENKLLI